MDDMRGRVSRLEEKMDRARDNDARLEIEQREIRKEMNRYSVIAFCFTVINFFIFLAASMKVVLG